MGRVLVVGGGIIGTTHAWTALRLGHSVTHLEREPEARGASVRNFGLIWIGGRAAGAELELALRSRELWRDVSADAPGTGLRAHGSLTVAQTPEEMAVIEEAAGRPDAEARGWTLLTGYEVTHRNPAVQGKVMGGLFCDRDATVEPRLATAAIRQSLRANESYTWMPGRTAVEAGENFVVDHTGARYGADRIVLCTGADHQGVAAPALADANLRRVRLHMLETEPFAETVTTSLADGDSLRYYPAYQLPSLPDLPPQDPLSSDYAIQLLLAQRLDGSLTIGDSHEYAEPFDFFYNRIVADEMVRRAESVLGRPVPPTARWWNGMYSQTTDGSLYLRRALAPGVEVVTGPGGRGMTMAPAIAEETFR